MGELIPQSPTFTVHAVTFNRSWGIPNTMNSIFCHYVLRQCCPIHCGCVLGYIIFLVQVRLRTEVLSTPSSTPPGFELMTSRSWQLISCHWDACSNHLAISDFFKPLNPWSCIDVLRVSRQYRYLGSDHYYTEGHIIPGTWTKVGIACLLPKSLEKREYISLDARTLICWR